MPTTAGGALGSLPTTASDEPGLTRALGDPSARLAVVEVARPISIAALSYLSSSRPLVVTCPTGTMAGQLADDLRQFLPADEVVHFPGWETLPFERVSPSVETMGQRLEILWRLRDPERVPAIIVTGVRALLQKLGPDATAIEPVVVRPGAMIDPDELSADARRVRLPPRGTRRAPRRVRPPRRDRRRVPVDRRRPDPHRPVGRRGRPADDVRRQRPALDRRHRRGVHLPRPRADADRRRAGARARSSSRPSRGAASSGSGCPRAPTSTAWRAGCRGSSTDDRLLTDVLPDGGEARARRTAADARPGDRPDRRGGRPRPHARVDLGPRPRPPLPPPARRPGHAARRVGRVLVDRLDAGIARHPARRGVGLGAGRRRRHGADRPPDRADRSRLPGRRRRRRRRLGGPPARAAARQRARLPGRQRSRTTPSSRVGRIDRRRTAAPRLHAAERQGVDRRRERPHRPAARPPHGPAAQARPRAPARSRTSRPATTSCTTSTASASTRGWSSATSAASSATTCSSRTRAATSSTCRATRSTRCASTSAARPRRSTASAAPTSPRRRAASARPCARSPRNSSCSTRSGSTPRATRSPRTRRGRPRWKRRSRSSRRPTSARRSTTSSATWSWRTRWTASCAATSGSARPRSPSAPRSRRSRTASRSPCSRRPRCSPRSTATRSPTASPASRSASRCSPASSPRRRRRR